MLTSLSDVQNWSSRPLNWWVDGKMNGQAATSTVAA
jgi:hypothetical protein